LAIDVTRDSHWNPGLLPQGASRFTNINFRAVMVRQDLTAESACRAVGYTSPSQFSREFRRLFGLTPAAETKRMRKSFAIPPAFPDAEYVSSH
jgi:AraC-like DNA-binding protein